MLRVSVPTEYSYCLLDCSGIGKHSQGANINISLNLMNLLRNVTALTFNIHQIIENYMTPISHFDVHGTWAVCIWLTLCFVTGLPLCKVILSSKPSLLIAVHLFLFHEYVSVPILLPLKKLFQPRLALLLCLLSSPADNAANPCWPAEPHCHDQLQSPGWFVPIFCLWRPCTLHGDDSAGSFSLLPALGYQHQKAGCLLHCQVSQDQCSTDLLVILVPVSSCFFVVWSKFYFNWRQSHSFCSMCGRVQFIYYWKYMSPPV